jgi:hypothetical protein
MNHHDRPYRQECRRRFGPSVEGLETRQLPSFFALYSYSSNQLAYQASVVRHEYDQYVSELKRLELQSQATPAEFLALRNDARAISAAASPTNLSPAAVQYKAVEVSLQLDRSPLYGWLGDSGWAEMSARLMTNLGGLNVPQPLISQTVTDMRAIAVSAGIDPYGYANFTNDFDTLRNAEQTLPSNPYYHFKDPGLYYTQHLRGFFRGWGVQKVGAESKLRDDLRTVQAQTQPGPAGAAVLDRDVQILQGLGAAVPSTTNQQLDNTYVAVFDQGVPGAQALSQLRSNLVTILGPAGTPARVKSVDRLVADAPAFFQATGASASNVQTIVTDVGALVNAGGGESLNPLKITIQPAHRAQTAG